MMRSLFCFFFAGLITVVSGPALAQSPLAPGVVRSGTLSFDGKATVGDFVGTTSTVSGVMTGGEDLSLVRGWVEAPVNTLKTGNGRRDRDLNKSMESAQYPTLRFELTGVAPQVVRGDTTAVTLLGSFKIHGVTRQVTLPATLIRQAGGLRLRSDFPLNLVDYEIGGLSKMLGMLKMHPDIVVHVDLLFGSNNPEAPPGN